MRPFTAGKSTVSVECAIREAGGEGGAELLRRLRASGLEAVLEITLHGVETGRAAVDSGRDPRPVVLDVMSLEVERRFGLRLLTPLADPDGSSRLAAIFWATHGAMSPRWSATLLLRLVFAATVEETAAVLRLRPDDVHRCAQRAARRIKAFNLEPTLPPEGPELSTSILDAARRLHGLAELLPAAEGPSISGTIMRELVRRWQHFVLFHPIVAASAAGREARFRYYRHLHN
jgi:hypothetical protein